jgi:hypothetical protein
MLLLFIMKYHENRALRPILAIGLQGATPGDYAARAKASSLAAFAVMCFA